MLYLTESDVAKLLSVEEVVPRIEDALHAHADGRVINNPRRRLQLRNSLLMSMEAGDIDSGSVGHKNYLAVPGQGVLSHFFLYDSASRELLAIMHANELGRIRTGATSGVAAKYMAHQNASRHAVFGAGFQAETQVSAISAVRPITEIRVWSRTEQRVLEFCERVRHLVPGADIRPSVDDAAELAAWADIVTVATRATEPLLRGEWLKPGVFINAIGSNSVMRAEIDADVVARSDRIVADSLEGARAESGDLIQAAARGALLWGQVRALSDVVAGFVPGRACDQEICLFESQGLGLEDLAAGRLAYEKARELGVGTRIEIS